MPVRKRIVATVEAADPADKLTHQEVELYVNDQLRGTKAVGPEGGRLVFGTLTIVDNTVTSVRTLVYGVDATGRSEVPAVTVQAFEGADTIRPGTPKPAVITAEEPAEGDEDLDVAPAAAPAAPEETAAGTALP